MVRCNQALARLFGRSPSELAGCDYVELFRARNSELGTGSAEVNASSLRTPSSEFRARQEAEVSLGQRWFRVAVDPTRDQEGKVTGAVAIWTDVTQRRHLEEQLRQAQKMEAIGHLAGGVAHDFNNLLTVINGFTEVILGNLEGDDPSGPLLQEVRKAGERAGALTRQLLAFSRKQLLQPKVIDLNSLLAEIAKLLGRMIGEDVTLAFDLDPHLGRIKADPGQIEQVIINLAVNARDAMPQGGSLTLTTRNVVLAHSPQALEEMPAGPYALLAVKDAGCGMTRETLARIFEPFFTTKEVGKGTGLGLATVYGIVKQSGGHVEAQSEVGAGTTFRIYLPLVHQEKERPEVPSSPLPLPVGQETVLLVEDDPGVRRLTLRLLLGQGYQVLEASSGSEGLAVAARHQGPIQLLITDVVMPALSGPQLARRLLLDRPETKVLYLSGYTDDAVLRHGILEQATNFLQKPFSLSVFAHKVRELLDGQG